MRAEEEQPEHVHEEVPKVTVEEHVCEGRPRANKDLGRLEGEPIEDKSPADNRGEREHDRIRDEQPLDPRGQLIAEDHPSVTVVPGTSQNPFSTLEYSEKIASPP